MQAALQLREYLEDALDAMLRRDLGCGKQILACTEFLRAEGKRRGDPTLSKHAEQLARAVSWEDRDAAIRAAVKAVENLVARLRRDTPLPPN